MWQQPIAVFPPLVPGALAWWNRRCKEASQTCKTFMVGRWSAWTVSDGEWEWVRVSEWMSEWVSQCGRVSQPRLMSTTSIENITLRSQLVQTLERSSSVIHRSLPARARGSGLMQTEMHRSQGTPGRTSDPLAVHIVPRLPRKRGGAQGTPGRTSDPLAVHIVPRFN